MRFLNLIVLWLSLTIGIIGCKTLPAPSPEAEPICNPQFAIRNSQSAIHNPKSEIRYVLDNGMVVILKEMHTAPVVALQMWVKAGAVTEEEYMGAGISHFVEHMLFKGTEKRGVGEIARIIRGAGGDINGYTAPDQTVYHISIASRQWETALEVMADAVMNSSFDPEELTKEQEVILKEINMNEDDPDRLLSRMLFSEAYRLHPYHHPTIGYEHLFKELTRDDLVTYYHRMYIPNNMILVMAGDFDQKQALSEIKEAFKDFARKKLQPIFIPKEPPQLGERRQVRQWDVSQAHFLAGFHTVSIYSDDVYPLDVAAIILGQGASSRLYREIKEKQQLVHSISAWSYTPVHPGIFGISVALEAEKLVEAEAAIFKEVNKLKIELVGKSELARAKQSVVADHIFSRETIEGQARDLASNELVTGDFNYSRTYVDRVKQVEPEDIRRVVRKYLRRDNLTVVVLTPRQDQSAETRAVAAVPREEITKTVLKNGLTVLVRENHSLPVVSIQTVFKGGVRLENETNNGSFNFLQRMLLKGTKHRTREEIASAIESKGGSIGTYGGNNSFGASVNVLSEDFDPGLEILADCLMNPIFPSEEMEKERELIQADINAQEDDIITVARKLLQKTMFKTHPYRFQSIGQAETVAKTTRPDIIQLHQDYCRPNNMVLAVFGDVDREKVIQKIKLAFKDFEPKELPRVEVPLEEEITQVREAVEEKERRQAVILLGFHGVDVTDPDRDVFEVMTSILSGQGSRLFENVRGKLGIAYFVGAFPILGLDPGAYIFYVGTVPEKIEEARAGLLEEIARLKEELVSEEEIARAKQNLIGTKEIGQQTNSSQGFETALDELYELGYTYGDGYAGRIEAVNREDIQRVARKYFKPDSYAVAIVRPVVSSQ
ncbi:MAG: pitrilysin family protein [bacterium]|nr:pitrilysin family protein [bacterium]